jgi:GT2 family glycosyltransferase
MNPKVTIITLNWNGWQDTIECLESLYEITYDNYHIILVDNASTDESLAKIDAYCRNKRKLTPDTAEHVIRNKPTRVTHYDKASPELGTGCTSNAAQKHVDCVLTVIQNDQNYGFAEGNNIAVAYALNALYPDYFLLLNNDTVVDRHFLNALVNAAELDQQIGLVQPKILTYTATTQIGSNVLDRPAFNDAKDVSSNDEDQNDKNREAGFFYAHAACVLIRNSVLFAFSGECFDPLLFAYFEDVDLSWMARLIGFKVIFCPESVCYHKLSATFGQRNPFTAYLHDRNTLRVMMKNYSFRALVFVLPLTIILALSRSIITSVVSLHLSEPYGVLKALVWNIVHLRSTLTRRRCIQSKRKVSDREIWSHILPYSLSIRFRLKEVWARRHS